MRQGHRLNVFQRMMLRWRELHPYNPVHVVRIAAALDLPRLRVEVATRLEATGLTGLEIDPGQRHFAWRGGPADVVLEQLPPSAMPAEALRSAIEQAFNRPFDAAARRNPFRFFVIDEGDGFRLGLAYDHFVAGGDAVARLLTDIALIYLGAAAPPAVRWTAQPPPTYRDLMLRQPRWALRAIAGLPFMVAGSRRASRTRLADAGDGRNGYVAASLSPQQSQAMLATARAWGVTLNDLLLAALLLVLGPRDLARRQHRRRTEIAVASIMNIRRDFAIGVTDGPGPCLAAMRVGHAVPDDISLQQLAREVHATTTVLKRDHLYLQSILALGVTALVWPWLSQRRRQAWFAKHHPLTAGVTTMNLNPLWAPSDAGATRRLDYLRAVPTGPLCPLVLAATTAHDRLHLGLAFRVAAHSPAEAADIAAALQSCLDLPAATAPTS